MNKYIKNVKDQFSKKFIDIMALIIASSAVVISISQGNTQREIERINKQPLLQIEFNKVDGEEIKGLKLSNVGYGPAIIKSFKYYLNEESFRKNNGHIKWLPTMGSMLGFDFEHINYLTEGYIVGNGGLSDEIYLLGTSAKQFNSKEIDKSFYYSETAKVLSEIIIEIEYTSLNSLDPYIYYIKFGENSKPSNYRTYEKRE